jgi:hypothetical protein
MTFEEMLDQALAMLQRRGRVTYRALTLRPGAGAGTHPGQGSGGTRRGR